MTTPLPPPMCHLRCPINTTPLKCPPQRQPQRCRRFPLQRTTPNSPPRQRGRARAERRERSMRCCPLPNFALDHQRSEPNDASAADPPPPSPPPCWWTPRRCPPLPAPPPASTQREPTRQRPSPSEPSKATPLPPTLPALPPSASRRVSGPTPRRCPPLPALPPASAQRSLSSAVAKASVARPRREPSKATPLPPLLPAPPPPPPPPPEQLGCCALPFFVWKLGSGGNYFAKRLVFFFEIGTNTTLLRIVKRFSCFSQKKCTILNS